MQNEISESTTVVESIYAAYTAMYGFPQGMCGQLAEHLQKEVGGEIVAGYLKFPTFQRAHWWLELNGTIIDPMSDELMRTDPHSHEEVHRDISKKYW